MACEATVFALPSFCLPETAAQLLPGLGFLWLLWVAQMHLWQCGSCFVSDGYYIFLQGDEDSLPGFVAHLVSPECSWEGTLCFRFWYHMYGTAETMALRVYMRKDDELLLLWEQVGNHGDMWHLGEVTVNTTGNMQVRPQALTVSSEEPCFLMALHTCSWS